MTHPDLTYGMHPGVLNLLTAVPPLMSDGGVRGEQKLVEMLEVQMGSSSSDYLTILGPII